MEGEFPLNRYIYDGMSPPPPLFPNYITAFQSDINGGESSFSQFYGGETNNYGGYTLFGSHPVTVDYSVNNTIGGYNETDLVEFQRNRLQQSSFINGDLINNQKLMRSLQIVSGSDSNEMPHLIPKSERFDEQGWVNVIEPKPLNIRGPEGSSNTGVYHQLPVLQSLEEIITQGITNTIDNRSPVSDQPSRKRFRSSSSSTDSMFSTRDLIERNQTPNIPFLSLTSLLKSSTPSVIPTRILARERRKMISDKIQCLQKLMPWDKKMDMATILEEAYKYIKFLQAQVSVLQAMPYQSSFMTSSSSSDHQQQVINGGIGGLEKLNRQQLLQVLVNSPVAQTNLYSRGSCVYSLEQLILLKKIAAHRILLQQMSMAKSSRSTSSSCSYTRESAAAAGGGGCRQ